MAGNEKGSKQDELAEVIAAAKDRHVTCTPSIPGFATVELDCRPYLIHPTKVRFNPDTLQPLLYAPDIGGFQVEDKTGELFAFTFPDFPKEEPEREPDRVLEDGTRVYANDGPMEINVKLTPVVMHDEDGGNVQCTMFHLACGLALHDAQEQGPDEVRRVMGLFLAAEEELRNAADEATKAAPVQDTYKVTAMYQTLSKTTACAMTPSANQHLYKDAVEILPINVGSEKEGPIPVIVTLDYDGLPIETRKSLTRFDKVTMDAVATRWEAGNRVMTAKQIAQTALNKKEPSDGMIAKIEESMNKMMFTRCHIDASAEARGRPVTVDGQPDMLESFELNGPVINASQSLITTQGGRRCDGYIVFAPPLPYVHDKAIGQITSYPPRLAEAISGAVSMNETTLVLRDYLIQRVARMNHMKRACATERRIRYETICEQVGIEARGRTGLKRMRETVDKILEAMKREGYILDYEQYKDGKSFAGVEIRLK